ncbi:hypothetical protein EMCRGX_G016073 [Ephydatia muelleri]
MACRCALKAVKRCVALRQSVVLGIIREPRQLEPAPLRWVSGTRYSSSVPADTEPLGDKALRLIGWLGGFYSNKAVLSRSAKTLYENCIDKVDYENFFKVCAMPDSFQSWFLVAQLHLWLCMVRLKREGKDGDYMLKQMVAMFWNDVEARMKILGVNSGRTINRGLRDLVHEFYGLVIAYDEGLLTDDRTMAAAVWRNLVSDKENTEPTQLALAVDYIRRQVKVMDEGDSELLLRKGQVQMYPLALTLSSTPGA